MNFTLEKSVSLIKPELNHVLEFGVWEGSTITQLRNSLPETFKVYGFDSFEGLPEDWIGTNLTKGFFNKDGVAPVIEGVEFFKGLFNDTIPQYRQIAKPIGLIHVDCDLYNSSIAVLYGLRDYIVSGTVIIFDEWYYNHVDIEEYRQHEQKAFYEWVNDFKIEYDLIDEIESERRIIVIK
jgi:hypothetical protein